MTENILEVSNLSKVFTSRPGPFSPKRDVRAVDGVSFDVKRGETLAIVGESGCGKSTLSRLVLGLLEATEGEVLFNGRDVRKARGKALRRFREQAQLIFQDPFASLNPRMTVGQIIGEPIWLKGELTAQERRVRVRQLLARVGLRPDHLDRYPHEFSGGQRQRIGIARAIAGSPELVIGDEPVSALDVSVQAQIINLLEELKQDMGLTFIIVAHDLVVVRHMSDRVAVMYLGRIVEIAPVEDLYSQPLHPYTRSLLDAVPVSTPAARRGRSAESDDLPDAGAIPTGCRFHPRCAFAQARCRTDDPSLSPAMDGGRQVACHFWEEIATSHPIALPPAEDSPKLQQRLAILQSLQARDAQTTP
ncbi:oligopeptide/dipeptide ABC transporter, ATPase subunit [Ketogulonicigenium vulgare Y25]|uniref:Oligopeptide/dipeptide ABC transporter, ATPase subunit n=1 Tax=Ketogulonicigenium vulgare (strain WSH-001) TaxID=759362 RepID=F9Y951_KETVW|nr:oligopeptide/dipeptide ABC transporter ATP-binding protein [Ketogulonicigenium vulgare]ADO43088.1 oligopeptide/dipeptide ABC transporter, ATPase subunit [Ketogulonicigenium vulgare Y25]AEM41268.1 Oligopeptide/dipeptide ABC transporter, ATPase subunit [Ketogulonicigenium vulgare WSH-001]ALJ81406.1 oligopeptide ABC transporter ATP-binding protein [Ketogulonicigenium vulgare]AOZ55001.1 oligopeptide/dipeptide ABC transporter ATPase subunit [Ketogulonicigenium vulgare]